VLWVQSSSDTLVLGQFLLKETRKDFNENVRLDGLMLCTVLG